MSDNFLWPPLIRPCGCRSRTAGKPGKVGLLQSAWASRLCTREGSGCCSQVPRAQSTLPRHPSDGLWRWAEKGIGRKWQNPQEEGPLGVQGTPRPPWVGSLGFRGPSRALPVSVERESKKGQRAKGGKGEAWAPGAQLTAKKARGKSQLQRLFRQRTSAHLPPPDTQSQARGKANMVPFSSSFSLSLLTPQLLVLLPCLESHPVPSRSPGLPGPGPLVVTHLAVGVSLDLSHADAFSCQFSSRKAASAPSRVRQSGRILLLGQRGREHPWVPGEAPRGGRGGRGLFVGEAPEPHTHNPAQLMETHSALVLLQTLVTGTASPLGPNARLFCPETHKSNEGRRLGKVGQGPREPPALGLTQRAAQGRNWQPQLSCRRLPSPQEASREPG